MDININFKILLKCCLWEVWLDIIKNILKAQSKMLELKKNL